MKISKSFLAAFLLAAIPITACMAGDAAASMRPSLVALQVEDLDASILWYTTHLGFAVKDRKEFPEHKLRLAILGLKDFELELVENAKSLKKSAVLSGKDATDITGFAKVTFTVADVGGWFQRLGDSGAGFAIKLRDSNAKPGEHSFVVLDNEGNWLQFVGKK